MSSNLELTGIGTCFKSVSISITECAPNEPGAATSILPMFVSKSNSYSRSVAHQSRLSGGVLRVDVLERLAAMVAMKAGTAGRSAVRPCLRTSGLR